MVVQRYGICGFGATGAPYVVNVPVGQYLYMDTSYPPVQDGVFVSATDLGLLYTDPTSGHQMERVNVPSGVTQVTYDPSTGDLGWGATASGTGTGGSGGGAGQPILAPGGPGPIGSGPLVVAQHAAPGSVPGGNGAGQSNVPAGGGTPVQTGGFNFSLTNADGSINWMMIGIVGLGAALLLKK